MSEAYAATTNATGVADEARAPKGDLPVAAPAAPVPPTSPPSLGPLRVWAGKREGRGHRQFGVPCQDAFAVHEEGAGAPGGRVAAAVADGLGSKPLSHFGSQAACDAAVASLAAEPIWDAPALTRAFQAAFDAVAAAAAERGSPPHELATTLQLATLQGGTVRAGMVGDGAIVAADADGLPSLLLAPAPSRYANEVVPLTEPTWRDHLRLAEATGARSVLLFTDGLTRLLLARSRAMWAPFAPFFASFLPRTFAAASAAADNADAGLVTEFLGDDAVDRSWDDDKCLVVIAHGPPV